MRATNVFKMGFLSMIAAAGLFVASNGLAADAHTTVKFEGVKANSGMATHGRSGNKHLNLVRRVQDSGYPGATGRWWTQRQRLSAQSTEDRGLLGGEKENACDSGLYHDVAKVDLCAWASSVRRSVFPQADHDGRG